MNTLLEDRYRRVLRLLPASYRAEREEEMVAAYMEVSGDIPDESNPKPLWGEIFSVAGLALRVRLGGSGAAPRHVAWGETARLVALLGLAFHAVFGVLVLASYQGFSGAPHSLSRLTEIALTLANVSWIVAFATLVRGWARVAKVTAAAGMAGTVSTYVSLPVEPEAWMTIPSVLMVVVPVLALLAGYHRDVERPVRSWWLVLPPIAVGVALATAFRFLPASAIDSAAWALPWLDVSGLATIALLIGGLFVLRARSAPVALALAVLGGLTLLTRAVGLVSYPEDEVMRALWASALVQAVLLALMVSALAAVGRARLPRQGNIRVVESLKLT
ncbi:hypothetical protein ACIBG8_51365 [Nonomuraea sp. NPDC050556]|uniref:hypothetical protein n=1 Tax=Nonomuraea sp. NPDC050556 TaxID=3364369 RepID=UPI0037AEC428